VCGENGDAETAGYETDDRVDVVDLDDVLRHEALSVTKGDQLIVGFADQRARIGESALRPLEAIETHGTASASR